MSLAANSSATAKAPQWQIVLVLILLPCALFLFWFTGRKPAPPLVQAHEMTVQSPSADYAPSTDPIWLRRGQEVFTRLHNEGKTVRMATVDFKGAGLRCSLVLVKGTWQTLTSADKDSLASLLHDYAKGKAWRLFDGGEVMRSNGSW